jgi:hypothetical protein
MNLISWKGKTMNRAIICLILGMACILSGRMATSAEQGERKKLKPCVSISGADSHINKPRCLRITSIDEWTRLWQEHRGKKISVPYDFFYDPLALPLIDFEEYMVIAVFQGESWNSAGLTFDSITEENDKITFKYVGKGYQTVGESKKVSVYGFFIIPRSTKSLVLVEGMRTMREPTPVWKERITFPKLK